MVKDKLKNGTFIMKNSTRLLYLATAIAGISFSQSASATILGNNYEGASSVTSNGT
jgi:hypothetical protein